MSSAVFSEFPGWLAMWATKATLLLAAAWCVVWVWKQAAASVRHLIWFAALASVLLLPAMSATLPRWSLAPWNLPLFGAFQPGEHGIAHRMSEAAPLQAARLFQPRAADASSLRRPLLPWRAGLLVLWLGGVAAVLGRQALALCRLRKISRDQDAPDEDAAVRATLEKCATRLGISRPIQLRWNSPALPLPITFGAVRPVISLPACALDWPSERLGAVFLHELAHIRRADWLALQISTLACALLWFHPLVWLAERALRFECERAADDAVISAGLAAPFYSSELLAIAHFSDQSETTTMNQTLIAAIPMTKQSTIEKRIRSLLDRERNRRALTRLHLLLTISLAATVLIPIATISSRAVEGAPAAGISRADRSSPEAAVRSFVEALNRGDMRAAAGFVQGVDPAKITASLIAELSENRPNFAPGKMTSAIEGARATVTMDALVLTAPSHEPEAKAEEHRIVNEQVLLASGNEGWQIVPGDLKELQKKAPVSYINAISAIFANPATVPPAREKSASDRCANQLRQLGLAVAMYAEQHGGKLDFPPDKADAALKPYLSLEAPPSCSTKRVRYLFNRKLANVSLSRISAPTRTVLFYETTAPGADARPTQTHGDGTNVVFVDGHVETVTAAALANLRWDG